MFLKYYIVFSEKETPFEFFSIQKEGQPMNVIR